MDRRPLAAGHGGQHAEGGTACGRGADEDPQGVIVIVVVMIMIIMIVVILVVVIVK